MPRARQEKTCPQMHWRITGANTRPVSLQCGPRGPENVILSTPRAQQTRRCARRWAERARRVLFCRRPEHSKRRPLRRVWFSRCPEHGRGRLPVPPMHSSRIVLVALLSRYSSRPRSWNGTRGPDSVWLAEGAEGLLVDAPTLVEPVLCQLVCQYRR